MASINKEEEMAADLQLRSRVFHFGQYKGGQEVSTESRGDLLGERGQRRERRASSRT